MAGASSSSTSQCLSYSVFEWLLDNPDLAPSHLLERLLHDFGGVDALPPLLRMRWFIHRVRCLETIDRRGLSDYEGLCSVMTANMGLFVNAVRPESLRAAPSLSLAVRTQAALYRVHGHSCCTADVQADIEYAFAGTADSHHMEQRRVELHEGLLERHSLIQQYAAPEALQQLLHQLRSYCQRLRNALPGVIMEEALGDWWRDQPYRLDYCMSRMEDPAAFMPPPPDAPGNGAVGAPGAALDAIAAPDSEGRPSRRIRRPSSVMRGHALEDELDEVLDGEAKLGRYSSPHVQNPGFDGDPGPPRKAPKQAAQTKAKSGPPGAHEGEKKERRRVGRWTEEETNALLAYVAQFGKGKWKEILIEGQKRHLFINRSQVDLKDKWRNLEKTRTNLESIIATQPPALPGAAAAAIAYGVTAASAAATAPAPLGPA